MIYALVRNPNDPDMIEAYYKWKDKTILAFVVHIDCIEDESIIQVLDSQGSVPVVLSVLKGSL